MASRVVRTQFRAVFTKNCLYILREPWKLIRDFVYPIILVLLLVWVRSQLDNTRYAAGSSDTTSRLDKAVRPWS